MPPSKHAIHRTSLHSYAFYFISLLLGVLLDLIFQVKVFTTSVMMPVGAALLVLATILIIWAQASAVKTEAEGVTREHFCKGPYCYTRHPTHWGLFLMILGFGFLANAFFVILFTVLSHIIAKLVFIKKHEFAMSQHFGQAYEEYKKLVKF